MPQSGDRDDQKGKGQGPGSGKDAPRRPSNPGALPRTTTGPVKLPSNPGTLPRTTSGPIKRSLSGPIPVPNGLQLDLERVHQTDLQKQLLTSAFGQGADPARGKLIGQPSSHPPVAVARDANPKATYDGVTPAPGVTSRDIWTALRIPVLNGPEHRSAEAYQRVLDQFAVAHNPRYEPDAPDKLRAHIFVWDVTRAMNAEIPHFVGPRELSLAQTADWLRHEGPMRGWRHLDAATALEAANHGCPVVAVPKEVRVPMVAMVIPGAAGPDGKPRLATAGKKRGRALSTNEALGVFAAAYFAHE